MFGGSLGKLREVIWPIKFVVGVMSCLVNLSSLSCLPHSTADQGIERIGEGSLVVQRIAICSTTKRSKRS